MDEVEEKEGERFLTFPELEETQFTVKISKTSTNINSNLIFLLYIYKKMRHIKVFGCLILPWLTF